MLEDGVQGARIRTGFGPANARHAGWARWQRRSIERVVHATASEIDSGRSCRLLALPACPQSSADGGVSDSGLVSDVGAGASDSGSSPDSGVAPDAGRSWDSGATGGTDAGDPLDLIGRSLQLARAECQYNSRCQPALQAYYGRTEAQCINARQDALINEWPPLVDAINMGRTTFDGAQLDACVNAMATADCDLGPDPGVCTHFFGIQGAGAPCLLDGECASGLYCSATAFGTCGVCTARAALQASCATAQCAAGAACLDVGGMKLCIDHARTAGASCGTVATGLCRGQLQCVIASGGASATCTRPASLGQACTTTNQITPACSLIHGNSCVANQCVAASFVAAGGSCAAPSYCDVTSVCNTTTSVCEALPSAGQPCNQGRCQEDAYCDGATCQSRGHNGAACTSNPQCVEHRWCMGSAGAQTCGPPAWSLCQ